MNRPQHLLADDNANANIWQSQFKRWQFIAAVDVITELIIFLLAVILLQGLFMSVKRKLAIGFAFIFRFP